MQTPHPDPPSEYREGMVSGVDGGMFIRPPPAAGQGGGGAHGDAKPGGADGHGVAGLLGGVKYLLN